MAPSKKQKPTADEPATDAKPVLTTRIIAPMQSIGRAGKSTFNDCLLYWLSSAGVHWGAMDLDEEHHTLSSRYEGFVRMEEDGPAEYDMPLFKLSEPEAVRELLGMLIEQAQAGTLPSVVVLDCPAQATEGLLKDFADFHALDLFDAHNIRLTVPLILSDDPAAATSIAKIKKAFGSRVDYLFIRNPKKGKSVQIEQRRVIAEMLDAGVPVVDFPAITDATMAREVAAVETAAGRRLPLSETAKRLSVIARLEVESFLWQVSYQMEDAEAVLIPNGGTIKTRIDRSKFPGPSAPATVKRDDLSELD